MKVSLLVIILAKNLNLVYSLEDGVVIRTGIKMIMFYGNPMNRRVTEIIDCAIEAAIFNYWISNNMQMHKLHSWKTAVVRLMNITFSTCIN